MDAQRRFSFSVSSQSASAVEFPAALPACAPVSGWRRMLGDSLVVGGSTAVCHALGVLTSLLLRSLLDPAHIGIWQGIKVFLSYANYTNLGVSKGATRELCIAVGRGDLAAAQRGLNLAFTVNTITSLLYAAGLTIGAVWIGYTSSDRLASLWVLGLLTVGGVALLQRHVTFQVTILRSRQAFGTAAQLSVQEAVLTLLVSVVATWLWGLKGLYLGTVVVLFGSLWFLRRRQAAQLRWAWNGREIVRLMGVGGPILLASMTATLFGSLDKLMILGYLPDGEHQLGCYSLALLITTQLYGLGNMLSVVTGPRYGELLGRTGSRREVARLAARVSELQAAFLALLAGLALVVGPSVLGPLLPDYQAGLAPLAWLVPGTLAMAMSLPASQYLAAVDGGRGWLAVLLIGTGIAAAGNYLALSQGAGINGVALATTVANAAYFLLLVAASLWRELSNQDRARYVLALVLTLLPVVSLAIAFKVFTRADANWEIILAQGAAILVLWSITMAIGWRAGDWRALWKKGRTA